jgi:hypothetical protein
MNRKHFANLCLLTIFSCTAISCSQEKIRNSELLSNSEHKNNPNLGVDGDDSIPIVTLDSNNQIVETKVTKDIYVAQNFAAASDIHDSILPALDKAEESGKPSSWNLRAIGVGIGITAEVGVGPVGVGFLPKMRLIFTNHSNPLPPPLLL